ncbi:hypothetical protein [Burkholderia lata]|nr:hypothetical protein [Burkholderia lata]
MLIPRLIDLYLQDRVPIDRIASHFPFSEIEVAMQEAESGRAIKPILRFE